MKHTVKRITRLFIGLFLYSVGIVLTINADLGLSPWDVFHQGLTYIFDVTMGQVSIVVGLILVVINASLGERIGWGTLGNMIFIGLFLDILMLNHLIPMAEGLVSGVVMMVLGMFTIGVATYFYLGVELGSGPRDGLMVALTKKTNKSVRLIRNTIESAVLILGYLTGGSVGIGTLIMALTIGHFVQLAFKLFKFDVSVIKHRFIDDDIKIFKIWLKKIIEKPIKKDERM